MDYNMDLTAIKSNKGYYIHREKSDGGYYQTMHLDRYLFDGESPQKTFHDQWFFIDDIPSKVSHMESQPNINHRYILTDDSLESDKIPAVILKDDAVESTDCEGNTTWKLEYAFYKSLYVEVSDEQPDIEVEDEFTFVVVLEIGEVVDPPYFKYPTGSHYDRWAENNKRETFVNRGNILHQELDKILFPSFLLHETPSMISSEDLYSVIREYVSTHVNPAVAVITSDYDFCFTVRKRVPLAKPYTSTYKTTPRGKRKPVTKQKYVDKKEVTVFEMTHSGRNGNYSGYTPIQGIEAKDEHELKQKIDELLDDLITQINEPIRECPTCGGCGVLFNTVETDAIKRKEE